MGGFILLLWLREQILVHDGPEWLIDEEDGNVFQLDVFVVNFIQNQVQISLNFFLYIARN